MDFDPIKSLDNIQSSSSSIFLFLSRHNIIFVCRLDAPAALERIKEDRPITIKDDKGNTSKIIAEIVALFITAMDKLKLDIRSMDELHGDMKDLNDSLGRLSLLPPGWGGKTKIAHWLEVLSGMQVGFCSLS